MMKRTLFFLMCSLMWLPVFCFAVKPYTPMISDPILNSWRWRHEEALNGLWVLCMDEAKDGTVWFGCVDGIVSYDGVDVTRIEIDHDLLTQLHTAENNRRIKMLKVLENGNVLALVGDHLLLRKDGEWEAVITDIKAEAFPSNISQSPDGSYWFLIPTGLWRISEDCSQIMRVIDAPKSKNLFSFCMDRAGNAWVVKRISDNEGHLIQVPVVDGRVTEKKSWNVHFIPKFDNINAAEIVEGEDGLIWYCDRSNSGIKTYDPENDRWVEHKFSDNPLNIQSWTRGHDGTIWGGQLGTLCRISPDGMITPYFAEQLQLPSVTVDLFETSKNRLWIIGHVGYVYSVDLGSDEWLTYEGLNYQCESSIGRQWFISDKGKAVVSHDLRTGSWIEYDQEDGLIERPGDIMISSHGLVWVAGSHYDQAAFSVFDGKRWQRYVHPEFARRIESKAAYEAMDRTIWFGGGGNLEVSLSGGGALQYGVTNEGNVQLLSHRKPPEFPYYVLSLAETKDRTLWIGSTIIYAYNLDTKLNSTSLPFPRDNTIDLVIDQDGTLWAAKEHLGIYRYLDGRWQTVSIGATTQQLADLLPLSDGTMLAASDQGVSRFDGKTWTPQVYSGVFGMSSRWSGLQESREGAIWLSYSRKEIQNAMDIVTGTPLLRSIRHRPEKVPPDTRITTYLKRVSQPGNSHIQWSAHDPWGKTPRERLQYSWRLDDGAWSNYSDETSRTFLDLDHGSHILEVRARDLAFNVDPTPARVSFDVEAPLWLRPWFIFMVLLIVFGSVAFIGMLIYFQGKRLKDRALHLAEVDRMKTSFFTNISHELNTPLTLMAGPLRQILRTENNEKNRKLLSMALRNADRVSILMSQLLDFRKLEQGKIRLELIQGDIIAHVSDVIEMLHPMAQPRGISLDFDAERPCDGWFDPDKLKKILQNLIGNAIKYTPEGGGVSIALQTQAASDEKRFLMIQVEDTGPGIGSEHLHRIFDRFYRVPEKTIVDGSGIGLNLTKELVGLWGGEIRAESPVREDKNCPGTRFSVKLPIDKPETQKETPA